MINIYLLLVWSIFVLGFDFRSSWFCLSYFLITRLKSVHFFISLHFEVLKYPIYLFDFLLFSLFLNFIEITDWHCLTNIILQLQINLLFISFNQLIVIFDLIWLFWFNFVIILNFLDIINFFFFDNPLATLSWNLTGLFLKLVLHFYFIIIISFQLNGPHLLICKYFILLIIVCLIINFLIYIIIWLILLNSNFLSNLRALYL